LISWAYFMYMYVNRNLKEKLRYYKKGD